MAKKSAVVIPARYASSRFPGKPLAHDLLNAIQALSQLSYAPG